MADGDLAFAAGLLVLLLVVTMAYMPIVVPLIAPDAAVSTTSIAKPLVLTSPAARRRPDRRCLERTPNGAATAVHEQGLYPRAVLLVGSTFL